MKPPRPPAFAVAACCVLLALPSCRPELPSGHDRDSSATVGEVGLEIVPESDPGAIAPVVWLRLSADGAALDPAAARVFQGEIGPGHLRQIEDGDLSDALEERLLPSRAWLDDAGGLLVAPSQVLELGETHSIALADPPTAWELEVVEADDVPMAMRVWPPEGASATETLGVWCAEQSLGGAALPQDPTGVWSAGAVGGAGERCVRFDHGDARRAEAWAAPPVLELPHGRAIRLDPRPLARDLTGPLPGVSPVDCGADEIPFGPGCATVADDRLAARNGEAATLWTVRGAGLDMAVVAGPAAAFTVWPLSPESFVQLEIATLDAAGAAAVASFGATTKPPMAHVVIMEVLANPNGAEPEQEWVELLNDGLVDASLEGWVLADAGGDTVLPPATLEPGARALLINESFVADGSLDPAPDPAAVLVRVPKLGKNGLSNQGEPLELRDAAGEPVSRFPATPKPSVAGVSIARVSAKAPDGDPTAFVKDDTPTPGAP